MVELDARSPSDLMQELHVMIADIQEMKKRGMRFETQLSLGERVTLFVMYLDLASQYKDISLEYEPPAKLEASEIDPELVAQNQLFPLISEALFRLNENFYLLT